MSATVISLCARRAQLQRALHPLAAPRLGADLAAVATGYALLPVALAAAWAEEYRTTLRLWGLIPTVRRP